MSIEKIESFFLKTSATGVDKIVVRIVSCYHKKKINRFINDCGGVICFALDVEK
jgi:hypothetical protein